MRSRAQRRHVAPDDVPASTLAGLLARHANGGRTALHGSDRDTGYAELRDESRRLARGLSGLGIEAGDRVAVWLPNTVSWLASFFACAQIGAIAVALNTRFRSGEVGDILGRSGAKAVVMTPEVVGTDLMAVLRQCAPDQLAGLRWLILDGPAFPSPLATAEAVAYADLAAAEPLEADAGRPETPCLIFTTSGTTKAPKFVLHDQRRILGHALDVARATGISEGSVMLQTAPFCGTFGISMAFAALAAGAALAVPETWDAREALRLAKLHRATHAMATDDAIAQLLAASDEARPLPDMRLVGFAGVNPALGDIDERATARGLTLAGLYGSSEVQAIMSIWRPDAPDRTKAGGELVDPDAEVRACDPETGAILPHGQMGELEFRVPRSRMIGYLGDEAATVAAHRPDGFFRSGDLGYTVAEGRFVFVARLGDSMRLGGFLVNPGEIEDALEAFDAVAQAQVVAVDTDKGPRPVGFVILADGAALDEAAILPGIAAKLAKFKVPVRLFPIDAFPVTVSANATKIQKTKLRERALELMRSA